MKESTGNIPRGSRPDAETAGEVILIKRLSEMRATYQVRLLAFLAGERGKPLVIEVPQQCRIHESLRELMDQLPGVIKIRRV